MTEGKYHFNSHVKKALGNMSFNITKKEVKNKGTKGEYFDIVITIPEIGFDVVDWCISEITHKHNFDDYDRCKCGAKVKID